MDLDPPSTPTRWANVFEGGVWRRLPDSRHKHWGCRAVALSPSLVLLICGHGSNECELLDLSTETWAPAPTLNYHRSYFAAWAVETGAGCTVLVAGGSTTVEISEFSGGVLSPWRVRPALA